MSFRGTVCPNGDIGLCPTSYIQIQNPGQHCQDLEIILGILDPVLGRRRGIGGISPHYNVAGWPGGG